MRPGFTERLHLFMNLVRVTDTTVLSLRLPCSVETAKHIVEIHCCQ